MCSCGRAVSRRSIGRDLNSATVVPMPGVLQGSEQIIVMLQNTNGPVYLSDFRLVATG